MKPPIGEKLTTKHSGVRKTISQRGKDQRDNCKLQGKEIISIGATAETVPWF